jgi:hypothetical protein
MNTLFQTTDSHRSFFAALLPLLFVFLFPKSSHAQTPPVLECPDSVILVETPGTCGIVLEYATMIPFIINAPLNNIFFLPPDNTFLPIGETDVAIFGTDQGGLLHNCVIRVHVREWGGVIKCDSLFTITLDENCTFTLTPDETVDGPYGCPNDMTIEILTPNGVSLGNVVNASMINNEWTVRTTDPSEDNSCTGLMQVEGDNLPPSITCPGDTLILCNQSIDPAITGLPAFSGCFPESDLIVSYTDQRLNSFCNGDPTAYEINRTWTATDPFEHLSSCVQHISARRIGLQEIVFPPNYDGLDEPVIPCSNGESHLVLADTSRTGVPSAGNAYVANAACSISVQFTDEVTNVCGASYTILRKWKIIDFCTTQILDHVQTIKIVDNKNPQFDIQDTIYVSTSSLCGAQTMLPPITQLDECSNYNVIIFTPWQTLFSNGGTVNVPQVPAQHSINYRVVDGCNNQTNHFATMIVSSNIIGQCPPNRTINCNYYHQYLEEGISQGDFDVLNLVGSLSLAANCVFLIENSASVNLDDCSQGTIDRTISVQGPNGNSTCTQVITVQHVSDFAVAFPADTAVVCTGNDAFDAGQPHITFEECEPLQITHSDIIFDDPAQGCYRMERTWTVINPCVTGSSINQEVVEASEMELHLDLDGDGDLDSLTFRDSWNTADQPGVNNPTQATGPDTDPDLNPWDGYVQYVQRIEVTDNAPPVFTNGCDIPEVCIESSNCSATLQFPFPEVTDCSPVTLTAASNLGVGFGPYLNVPRGNHPVVYTATDECNNIKTCTTFVAVVDCLPPTPICFNLFPVTLGNGANPSVTVFASDLNSGSNDNCPGALTYSFSQTQQVGSISFNCCDLGLNPVELWITDVAGNQSSCNVNVVVQSPAGNCSPCNPTMSGKITTMNNVGVGAVTVSAGGAATTTTNNSGDWTLTPPTGNVTATPTKNFNHPNGITTFDIVLLTKHVLATQLLDSPYKIIAADVNRSNSVTVADALELRKIVLGITTTFPNNNPSWRFVRKNYVFPNPANPFSATFPEVATINNFNGTTSNVDFVGIKVGDLNLSANPLNINENDMEERTDPVAWELKMENVFLEKGGRITLPVTTSPGALHGFQCEFLFDKNQLAVHAVRPVAGAEDNYGIAQKGDQLRLSCAFHSALELAEEQPFFVLDLEARSAGFLSDMIRLSQTGFSPEAYAGSLAIHPLKLTFTRGQNPGATFQAFPAQPNPFNRQTTLPFYLPQSTDIQLFVFDPSGKTALRKEAFFESGDQQFLVGRAELPGSGLFFYRLQSTFGAAVGKLVVE